jgi:hypothetical protein
MTSGIVPPARPANPPARPIFETGAGAEIQGPEPESVPAASSTTTEERAEPVPHLPFCIECAETLFNELEAQNDELPASEQESRPALALWARVEAQKVRFFREWVCPRCEHVDIGSLYPQFVPLREAVPNRASRRRVERLARSSHLNEEVR